MISDKIKLLKKAEDLIGRMDDAQESLSNARRALTLGMIPDIGNASDNIFGITTIIGYLDNAEKNIIAIDLEASRFAHQIRQAHKELENL